MTMGLTIQRLQFARLLFLVVPVAPRHPLQVDVSSANKVLVLGSQIRILDSDLRILDASSAYC